MDRNWIYVNDRFSDEYSEGVSAFIEVAKKHLNEDGKTRCPCQNCLNIQLNRLADVERHLFKYGMSQTYIQWIFHGEKVDLTPYLEPALEGSTSRASTNYSDERDEMLDIMDDLRGPVLEDIFHEDETIGPNSPAQNDFSGLVFEVEQELYPGCKRFSSLNFLVKLMHIKVLNQWSNKSFDMLLQLLIEAFPEGVKLPDSYYNAKKKLRDLGLGYELIHACKYDCALFWKEFATHEYCPHCGESRYKINDGKGKKIPHKVLRYFPLKTRLQRMFLSKHTAKDMRWHKEKRCDTEGVLRHPADGEGWKHLDNQYPSFARDPRNVRLALSSDGFNPFGNMSTSYSMWPVILIPYNLPPWKCMKEPFFFMSLLIPGPRSPGKEIDIYLQPLINELKDLWVSGVRTYDSFSGNFFQLHAALLWTINDFPAYGDLSGWRTKGYKACPVCCDAPGSLKLRSKIGFMGHRRFLPMNHAWRSSRQHDGKQEHRPAPNMITGQEIINQLSSLNFPMLSKNPHRPDGKRKCIRCEHNWSKKSIFFYLPYWQHLKLRHKLDVMHIEKNVCDNLVGTILNIDGKTKDTIKARLDLADLKIRKELQLQQDGNRLVKPHASYALSISERVDFCKFLKSVKFPDGFASNISRCVNEKDGRISGLKSHDCHVLIQRLLPIGLRAYLRKDICTTIIEFCSFFHDLCAKSLQLSDLDNLQENIVIILCKLEKIFPPAFFDVMVHLTVHLPWETKIVGPVGYSWMYPIERSLRFLKQYVKNKARPEGSIAEAYIVNESLKFCSLYLHGIETRFNRPERNDDTLEDDDSNGEISVFSQHARPFGGGELRVLSLVESNKVHWYTLNNCEEIESYHREHMTLLQSRGCVDIEQRHEVEFPKWFKIRAQSLNGEEKISDELYALACGPDFRARSYSGCIVNGVRFHTKDRDSRRTTQNSGVMVPGEHEGVSINFYGVLTEVLRLQYINKMSVYLFKCDWFDTCSRKRRIINEFGFTSINIKDRWYKDDPFILPSQAQQVFYLNDHKYGNDWKLVQKIQQRHVWDVSEVDNDEVEEELTNERIHTCLTIEDENLDSRTFDRDDVDPLPIENIAELEMQPNEDELNDDDIDNDEMSENINSSSESESSDEDKDIDT